MELREQFDNKTRKYACELTSDESTGLARALAFYYTRKEKELDETVPALRDVAEHVARNANAGETVDIAWSVDVKNEILEHIEKALSEYAAALLISKQLQQALGKNGLKDSKEDAEYIEHMAMQFREEVLVNNLTSSITRYESEA